MKKRKFAGGGEADYDFAPDLTESSPRFDDDTYARGHEFRKSVEGGGEEKAAKPVEDGDKKEAVKQRVVSKKELEASGLSLRDFLNKERGLTRRKESSAKPSAKPSTEPSAEPSVEPTVPAKRPGMMQRLRDDSAMREKAAKRMREDTPSLSLPTPTTTNDPMGKDYGAGRVDPKTLLPYKKGGSIKKYAKGGSIDGIAQRGKTRGRTC